MIDICFLITTYNRPESCQKLVDSLQGIGEIVVINDGCDYVINGCTQIFSTPHLGKGGYFFLVNKLWGARGNHKYYMMLPDDFLISREQIEEAIRTWEGIHDPLKACLNLFADRIGVACWTRVMPSDKGSVWQTGWVDMCFLCENSFFAVVPRVELFFRNRGNRGSGVGAFVSIKLVKRGFHLYQVKESLVSPQGEHCTSQMHDINQVSYDNRRHRIHSRTRTSTLQGNRQHRRPGR
jgi:hypothetical protein